MFEKSAIVAAHPDDEVLWFSSLLSQVGKIIICFLGSKNNPQLGVLRKLSLQKYPLANMISLEIDQSDTFNGADWNNPVLTKYGIAVPNRQNSTAKYRANYHTLHTSLLGELSGCTNIFTHNPWGEYGNEDHIQVYRVVKDLQQKVGFKLWYSRYCSNKSYPLMLQQKVALNQDRLTLKTDKILARKIKKIYQDCKCWTWYEDWEGFNEESFLCESPGEELVAPKVGNAFPLNFMLVNVPETKQSLFEKLFGLRLVRASFKPLSK